MMFVSLFFLFCGTVVDSLGSMFVSTVVTILLSEMFYVEYRLFFVLRSGVLLLF